ncbi:hypothetical protein AB3R30_13420 [Leptolyngbyaceae cyanobacterium UHCC 1019]
MIGRFFCKDALRSHLDWLSLAAIALHLLKRKNAETQKRDRCSIIGDWAIALSIIK